MPRGNRTGPMGMGPMTGRGAGFCAGFGVPGFLNRGFGFVFGRGRGVGGGGRGWRKMFYATGLTGWQRAAMAAEATPAATASPTVNAEKQMLEMEIEAMQSQLDAMKKRLAEMESGLQ